MKDVKVLYTDGGVVLKNPSDIGGSWAYCGVDSEDRLAGNRIIEFQDGSIRPGTTNNETELIAAVLALKAMEPGWSGILRSDSEVTLRRLRQRGEGSDLSERALRWMNAALDRVGEVKYERLGGHPNRKELASGVRKDGELVSIHNVWCDGACKVESARVRAEWDAKQRALALINERRTNVRGITGQ